MAIVTPTEVQNALTNLTTAQVAEIQAVIDVAVACCESYCRTILDSRETVEVVQPESIRLVRLRNRPVSSVARIAAGLGGVLQVAYTGAASRATAGLTGTGDPPYTAATGLLLTSVSSGVATTTTLTLSASPTLADLKAAVEAVTGWTATIGAGFAGFATADLIPDLATRSALGNGMTLWAYTTDIQEWDLDNERGEVHFVTSYFPSYRHPDRTWGGTSRTGRVWVRYTAGYQSAPSDLKRAVILTTKAVLDSEQITGMFSQEKATSGNQTYFYSYAGSPDVVPPTAKAILNRKYRRVTLG